MNESSARPSHQDEVEQTIQLTEAQVLSILKNGEIEERGLLPYSSNHSFLVIVRGEEHELPAVYKPQRGESPLWDFEWGTLCKRETAAYVVNDALGWGLVPPTILRQGTRGLGSVQFFVVNDTDAHYFTVRADARFTTTLRKLVLFDYMVNNADRKSGHCLVGDDGQMWGIDHGICFHTEYKLRTVVWEFGGQAIEPELHTDIARFKTQLAEAGGSLERALQRLLNREEYAALQARAERLLMAGCYPSPSPRRRNYPWPPI